MPIDTREKRQSALSFLVPTFVPGVEPDSPTIEEPERQASYWDYSGILVAYPVPSAVVCATISIQPLLVATILGQSLVNAALEAHPLLMATVTSFVCEEVSV